MSGMSTIHIHLVLVELQHQGVLNVYSLGMRQRPPGSNQLDTVQNGDNCKSWPQKMTEEQGLELSWIADDCYTQKYHVHLHNCTVALPILIICDTNLVLFNPVYNLVTLAVFP